jgi:nitrate/TMAO reductase-like tetraheme cytochrome c subunit
LLGVASAGNYNVSVVVGGTAALASTNNQLVSLNKQVAAISNHSNAQVLPELQQTKAEMNTNLVNTEWLLLKLQK